MDKEKTIYGDEAVIDVKKFLDEFKENENKLREDKIKMFDVSNIDNDISNNLKKLIKEEENLLFIKPRLENRNLDSSLSMLYNHLSLIKQDMYMNINLANLRRQYRINKTLFRMNKTMVTLSILALLVMCIQALIAVLMLID